jgi:hypothetical protein
MTPEFATAHQTVTYALRIAVDAADVDFPQPNNENSVVHTARYLEVCLICYVYKNNNIIG